MKKINLKSENLFRYLSLFIFLACSALLAGCFLIQYLFYVEPCSLCILQRFVYLLLGITSLIAAIHNPKIIGRYFYCLLNFATATIGILLSGRQVWLQHLPYDQLPACTPGLERLLKIHPFIDSIIIILKSSGECGKEKFAIFGVTLAEWGLMSFIFFAVVSLAILVVNYKQRKFG